MGEALDIAATTDAFMRMLLAPHRPTPGAWWAEREPSLRRLSDESSQVEISTDQRHGLARDEAALLVDRLLAPVARGRGALDLAIGECLGSLSVGDRTLRLGYVSIGDYAREKLGIPARTAQAMAQLSRELRDLPLLRDAVLRGEVSAAKARIILKVSYGDEAGWVQRARTETVRALAKAVKALRGEDEAEEAWEEICLPLSAAERAEVDEALALAGKVAGTMPPRPQRLEAMAQEFLSEYPDPDDGAAGEAGQDGCRDRCCQPGRGEADVGAAAGATPGSGAKADVCAAAGATPGSGAKADVCAAAGAAAGSGAEADVCAAAGATSGSGAEADVCAAAGATSGSGAEADVCAAAGAAAANDPDAGVGAGRGETAGAAAGWPGARHSPPRDFPSCPVEDWLEAAKEALEAETRHWEALGVLDPVAAPRGGRRFRVPAGSARVSR